MKNVSISEKNPPNINIKKLIQRGYYSQALKEIENAKDLGDIDVLIFKSIIFELNGDFEHDLGLAYLALSRSKEEGSFKHELASNICIVYALWRMNKFDTALDLISNTEGLISEMSLRNKQTLEEEEAALYNIKGLILWKIDKLDLALTSLQKGLSLRQELQNDYDISYSLNNIGNVYLKQNHLEQAYNSYHQSLELRIKLKNRPALAASYNSLARYYEQNHNYSQALYYHKKSLKLWKNVNNKQFIAKSLRFIGSNYQFQNNKRLALKYYQRSLKLFEEINNKTDYDLTKQLIKDLYMQV